MAGVDLRRSGQVFILRPTAIIPGKQHEKSGVDAAGRNTYTWASKTGASTRAEYSDRPHDFSVADRKLLVWEYAPCHIPDIVTTELKKFGWDVRFIPRGCTDILEPVDLCFNKSFKSCYTEAMSTRELLQANSPDKVKRLAVLSAVSDAYNALNTPNFLSSVERCLRLLNGLEDDALVDMIEMLDSAHDDQEPDENQ
ncbi:hypothetical protein RI367_003345 [Sorochytrium milnesiophthora]